VITGIYTVMGVRQNTVAVNRETGFGYHKVVNSSTQFHQQFIQILLSVDSLPVITTHFISNQRLLHPKALLL